MNNLSSYFQDFSQLSISDIQSIRARLVATLASAWPQLDTQPNSVAGDLLVTPDAILFAQAEAAMAMLLSDLDLANVAAGTVYNPTFVQAYLKNLGIIPLSGIASTGVIALTLNANQNYVIDPNAQFTFGSSVFQILPGSGNPVVIYSMDASTTTNGSNQWVLTQTGAGRYTVYIPVTGPSGSSVSDGSSATYTLTLPQLVSVTAAGDFNSGTAPESLSQLAQRAQTTFAAANLNTRSGALSFLTQHWPQMVGSYVTLTGDPEMLRAGVNPLGIADGAMDIFVKSSSQLASGFSTVTLTYDATVGGWIGALDLPSTPAFFSMTAGIFQTSNFMNSRSLNHVYAQSSHPSVDNSSIAFSKYEKLGIFIVDTSPQNSTAGYVSLVSELAGTGCILSVAGEYASYYFNTSSSRQLSIRMVGTTTLDGVSALSAAVRDNLDGETGQIYFIPNSATNPTALVAVSGTTDYNRLLRGLNLTVTAPSGSVAFGSFIGSNFSFGFAGRSATFSVNYLYDPTLLQIDTTLQDPNNHPIGVDLIVRSFMPCYVTQFTVNYRIGYGQTLDEATAQAQIFDYLSTIGTPETYEESQIGQIMIGAGATGLISVSKTGIFYPSLANYYVNQQDIVTNIPKLATNTLIPPINNLGISTNTVTYILSQNIISFNATVI